MIYLLYVLGALVAFLVIMWCLPSHNPKPKTFPKPTSIVVRIDN